MKNRAQKVIPTAKTFCELRRAVDMRVNGPPQRFFRIAKNGSDSRKRGRSDNQYVNITRRSLFRNGDGPEDKCDLDPILNGSERPPERFHHTGCLEKDLRKFLKNGTGRISLEVDSPAILLPLQNPGLR